MQTVRRAEPLVAGERMFEVFFPCIIQRLDNDLISSGWLPGDPPQERVIVLNRHYKPLGTRMMQSAGGVYDEHPSVVTLSGLTPDIARRLCVDGDGTQRKIFLYRNDSHPTDSEEHWAAYVEKLTLLSRLEVQAG